MAMICFLIVNLTLVKILFSSRNTGIDGFFTAALFFTALGNAFIPNNILNLSISCFNFAIGAILWGPFILNKEKK